MILVFILTNNVKKSYKKFQTKKIFFCFLLTQTSVRSNINTKRTCVCYLYFIFCLFKNFLIERRGNN